jgi:pimeloyl-ACP methyl ester carboxylesterase
LRTILIILVALLAWLGAQSETLAQSRPSPQLELPQLEEADCFVSPPAELGDEQEVECGYLIVPERRRTAAQGDTPEGAPEDDEAQTIQVAYMRYRTAAEEPGEPLVLLAGGPGDSGIVGMAEGGWLLETLLLTRDVIALDQRGTGFSVPSLNCLEWYDTLEDLPISQYPENEAAGCRDYWVEQGVALDAYSTAASAADVSDLITALGYERATLLGVSYGSKLALMVMRLYPERVAAAILDGAAPVEINQEEEHVDKINDAFEQVFAMCEADQACAALYPGLRSRFYALVAELDADPANLTLGEGEDSWEEPLQGLGLVNSLYIHLFAGPAAVAEFPYRVAQVELGDYTYLTALLNELTTVDPLAGDGLYNTIHCAEEVLLTTPEALLESIEPYPRLNASLEVMGVEWLTSAFDDCESWGVQPAEQELAEATTSDIPTLILQGGLDFQTPFGWARQAQAALSNSTLVYLPNVGHVTSFGDYCAASLVAQFAADPAGGLDTSCLALLPAINFYAPELAVAAPSKPVVLLSGDGQVVAGTVIPATWWALDSPAGAATEALEINAYQPFDANQVLRFGSFVDERPLDEIAYELAQVERDELERGDLEQWTAGELSWQVLEVRDQGLQQGVYALRRRGDTVHTVTLEGIFLDLDAAIRAVLMPALRAHRTGRAALNLFQPVNFVDPEAEEESPVSLQTVMPPAWTPLPDDALAYTAVDGNTSVYLYFMEPEEIVARLAREWTGEEKPAIERIVVGDRTWALFTAYDEGWSYVYAVTQDRQGTYVFELVGDFYDAWGEGIDYLNPMMAAFSVTRE